MSLVDDLRAAQSPDMDLTDMIYEFPQYGRGRMSRWRSEVELIRDIVDAVPKIAVLSINPDNDDLVVEVIGTA